MHPIATNCQSSPFRTLAKGRIILEYELSLNNKCRVVACVQWGAVSSRACVSQCLGMVLRDTRTVNTLGGKARRPVITTEYITFAVVGDNAVIFRPAGMAARTNVSCV